MRRAYVVGLPGAGKSSLLRHITADLARWDERRPFAHIVYARGPHTLGMQLGGDHPTFSGTDRLSMGVQPLAIQFVTQLAKHWPDLVVLGEGDRLANAGFLDAFGGDLVWLDTPPDLAGARRAARSNATQSATWLAGRATKVRRLVEGRDHIRLDGTLPPDDLAAAAIEAVPAFASLHERSGP